MFFFSETENPTKKSLKFFLVLRNFFCVDTQTKMNSWADLCEDDDPSPQVYVKAAPKPAPKIEVASLPECYCGEPSVLDMVKKAGKREKLGTPFVACATGQCKYWYALPVPDDLPEVNCLCDKRAAACKVKNPESRFCGKYISSCAFGKCKFYKVHS